MKELLEQDKKEINNLNIKLRRIQSTIHKITSKDTTDVNKEANILNQQIHGFNKYLYMKDAYIGKLQAVEKQISIKN